MYISVIVCACDYTFYKRDDFKYLEKHSAYFDCSISFTLEYITGDNQILLYQSISELRTIVSDPDLPEIIREIPTQDKLNSEEHNLNGRR